MRAVMFICLAYALAGCAAVAVVDTAVSVTATAVEATADVAGAAVDVITD